MSTPLTPAAPPTGPAPGRRVSPGNLFVPFPRAALDQSLPGRFEQQVRAHAGRVAVQTSKLVLTYDALNRAANRLAWAILARRGPAGQEPVALLLDRGADAVLATLAVLKAGKICVPLDPAVPRARLAQVFAEARPGLLLASQEHSALARELSAGTDVIDVGGLVPDGPDADPGLPVGPDDLAFILYTSGSSGRPKGVVHDHRSILHDCMRRTNCLHYCAGDRWTLFGLGTGQAVKNVFAALLTGGALHPLDVAEQGLAALPRWLAEEGITIFNSSVSLFRDLGSILTGTETFPALRLIRLAGEAVTRREVELWKARFPPHCLFANMLSTTETGSVRLFLMDRETVLPGAGVPVGYAAEDVEVSLRDEGGSAVGPGEVGEIVVQSRYLARGYWRRPDLTDQAFRPAPEGAGGRLYHTGDLGRMLPDGCLEHLGRKDFRVKIRGYRVEPAEVEMALTALESVKAAAVLGREDVPGEVRLVAYVVPAAGRAPTVGELRRALAGKLPDYMVPSAFVTLPALPVLPGGKVDRRALPAPGRGRPDLGTDFVAPRTPVEEELARVWAEILKLDRVGVHDNFLELGGNSLRAGQVVARVLRAFQVEVPLRTLFQSPTVADMAVAIVQQQARRIGAEEIERMLSALEGLSVEQARQLLGGDGPGG